MKKTESLAEVAEDELVDEPVAAQNESAAASALDDWDEDESEGEGELEVRGECLCQPDRCCARLHDPLDLDMEQVDEGRRRHRSAGSGDVDDLLLNADRLADSDDPVTPLMPGRRRGLVSDSGEGGGGGGGQAGRWQHPVRTHGQAVAW